MSVCPHTPYTSRGGLHYTWLMPTLVLRPPGPPPYITSSRYFQQMVTSYPHTCTRQALFGQLLSLNKASNLPAMPALNWSRLGTSVTFSALPVSKSLSCICLTSSGCLMPSSLLHLFAHCCHLQPSHRPTPLATLLDCSSRFAFLCFLTCHIHPADGNSHAVTYFLPLMSFFI